MSGDDPVAAVRAYFAAWNAGEDVGPFATGRLAELGALAAAVADPGELLRHEVDLRAAELDARAEAEALVRVEGSVRTSFRDPYSGALVRRDESLAGPVKTLPVEGAWRVADHCVGGRRVLAGLASDVEGAGSAGGLAARAVALHLAHGFTWLYLELASDRADAVRVRRANLHPRGLLPKRRGQVFGGASVPPGGRRIVVAGWRGSLGRLRGRVRLLAYGEAAEERVELRFAVRAEEADPAHREPLRIGAERP